MVGRYNFGSSSGLLRLLNWMLLLLCNSLEDHSILLVHGKSQPSDERDSREDEKTPTTTGGTSHNSHAKAHFRRSLRGKGYRNKKAPSASTFVEKTDRRKDASQLKDSLTTSTSASPTSRKSGHLFRGSYRLESEENAGKSSSLDPDHGVAVEGASERGDHAQVQQVHHEEHEEDHDAQNNEGKNAFLETSAQEETLNVEKEGGAASPPASPQPEPASTPAQASPQPTQPSSATSTTEEDDTQLCVILSAILVGALLGIAVLLFMYYRDRLMECLFKGTDKIRTDELEEENTAGDIAEHTDRQQVPSSSKKLKSGSAAAEDELDAAAERLIAKAVGEHKHSSTDQLTTTKDLATDTVDLDL
ncbi:unnamed protein product [Amoebophrya sp. A25]|nr:unnamed protein product [Amoebophrya sp. A25]|eukprot:GSA25T00023495001.1